MNKSSLALFSSVMGLLMMTSFMPAQQNNDRIIFVDTHLIAPNKDMWTMIANAIKVAPKLFINHPILTTAYLNPTIEKAIAISKTTRGITNIISKLTEELAKEGYILTPEEQCTCIQLAIAPKPNYENIATIKRLKQQGYTVIGFANRDYYEFHIFKLILKVKYNILIDDLFDGYVTVSCWKTKDLFTDNKFSVAIDSNHLLSAEPFPQDNYINTMIQLKNSINPEADFVVIPKNKAHALALNDQTDICVFESLQVFEANQEPIMKRSTT